MPTAGLAANPHESSDTGEQAVRAVVEQVMRAVVEQVCLLNQPKTEIRK
jgi:hypothetical protein